MSPVLVLYALILAIVVFGLWAAYKLLGTPSKLQPADYTIVLEDLLRSVTGSAAQLRQALEAEAAGSALEDVATESRKIFQTGYYQTLRLRPAAGPDSGQLPRSALGRACEAYDWASRMASGESLANPAIRAAVFGLMDAGDRELEAARQALTPSSPSPERSAP
jgi:hypothetical protein